MTRESRIARVPFLQNVGPEAQRRKNAQVECPTVNREVAGSNPVVGQKLTEETRRTGSAYPIRSRGRTGPRIWTY